MSLDLDAMLARNDLAIDQIVGEVLEQVPPDCRVAVAGRLAQLRNHACAVGVILTEKLHRADSPLH